MKMMQEHKNSSLRQVQMEALREFTISACKAHGWTPTKPTTDTKNHKKLQVFVTDLASYIDMDFSCADGVVAFVTRGISETLQVPLQWDPINAAWLVNGIEPTLPVEKVMDTLEALVRRDVVMVANGETLRARIDFQGRVPGGRDVPVVAGSRWSVCFDPEPPYNAKKDEAVLNLLVPEGSPSDKDAAIRISLVAVHFNDRWEKL